MDRALQQASCGAREAIKQGPTVLPVTISLALGERAEAEEYFAQLMRTCTAPFRPTLEKWGRNMAWCLNKRDNAITVTGKARMRQLARIAYELARKSLQLGLLSRLPRPRTPDIVLLANPPGLCRKARYLSAGFSFLRSRHAENAQKMVRTFCVPVPS